MAKRRNRVIFGAVSVVVITLLAVGALTATRLTAQAASLTSVPYNSTYSAPIPSGANVVGAHNPNAQLQVDLVLHPQHESQLNSLIQSLNTPGSSQYQKWLTPEQFNTEFAPPKVDTTWLTSHGLKQVSSSSPLVLAFTGTAAQFESAFHVSIKDYRTKDGKTVYANAAAPQVPSAMVSSLAGIVGLDDVLYGKVSPQLAYPSKLAAVPSKPNYGGSPGGNGLTPSQIRGIYNANPIYNATKGGGKTLAVFELSEYTHPDIQQYEAQFGIPNVPINNIYVDGGPCDPTVLEGAPCSYGAAEVELDIEFQLAIAPGISKIDVYNGPNSDTGVLDTYFAIAHQNKADVISTSWGECESALSSGASFGEFLAFAEMALQGQSISSAAGDAGAYDCEHDFAPPYPSFISDRETDDPTSDPLMTGVGGTSFFGTFDPGANENPTYPTGDEYVWNTLNNCGTTDFIFEGEDFGLCPFGAGGGGDSMLWAKPFYQNGQGTTSSQSAFGSFCDQRHGVQCRETPDVSLLADPNSGYAEYCTDVGGGCPEFYSPDGPPGWVQIGGTSASSPIWSGIVALADSLGHERLGLVNPALYLLDNPISYSHQLHDMKNGATYVFGGVSYFTNSNGVGTPPGFTETPGYDMATGVGTPNISNLVPALALLH